MVTIILKELTYEQMLERVLYRNNKKCYLEISKIIRSTKAAAFDICKRFGKTRVKIVPSLGNQKLYRYLGPIVP